MKKVLFALVLVGGLFLMGGCAKDCECVGKYDGEEYYRSTVPLDEGEKCSDNNFYLKVGTFEVEVKCTPNLF